ncbi:hypothetical protein [Rhodococcus sp. RDE2]|uniref:hypothetical protein n=1 Tax=Rhodococcus sp. RDE2 TaxID=2885078 RepID=UPI001E378A0D|nr:hypothetical protein [Rhodococcus sp. RDE2]BDB62356.1 hypothetical protein RDE2_41500 [Rhodococcus sp. RDE2]
MGQMKTIRKADWAPRPLLAPDGRSYTPGSFREDRELRSRGYVPAPVDNGDPVPAGDTPVDAVTAAPESAPADVAAAEIVAAAPEPEQAPAPAPQTTSKAKAARSNGESK